MPGNFQLTTGFNVNVDVPFFGSKEEGDENKDPSLSGKYLIVGSRHIIKGDPATHETVIECASTSSDQEFITESTSSQTEALESY